MTSQNSSPSPSFSTVVIIFISFLSQFTLVTTYEPGCSTPLGLGDGRIEDWQLIANSLRPLDPLLDVKNARLYQPRGRCWCAQTTENSTTLSGKIFTIKDPDKSPWIFIDLGVSTSVTGLLLQGRGGNYLEWTTHFYVALSDDAYEWNFVNDLYGKKKIFQGNKNTDEIKTIWFDKVQNGRFVKIIVLTYHKGPCLRFEILGCQECAQIISGPGMSSGFSSSSLSKRDLTCDVSEAHIFSHKAWCPNNSNGNQYLQIDIGSPTTITGIMTKGRGYSDGHSHGRKQWVISYTLSYSNDSHLWYYYKETNHISAKIFGGNMNQIMERKHFFNSPFASRFIRIHPKSWRNHIALRVALLGCPVRECELNFFRINKFSACIENLAWKKDVWTNDKRHMWKDWKYGQISQAVNGNVNGLKDINLKSCAILDDYYVEKPILMIDLGQKREINGVQLLNWQGDGQDKVTTYRDYVLDLDEIIVFVSNKPKLDGSQIFQEPRCGSLTRENNALFHPQIHFECAENATFGRYIYVLSIPVKNRWSKIFNSIICQVYVY